MPYRVAARPVWLSVALVALASARIGAADLVPVQPSGIPPAAPGRAGEPAAPDGRRDAGDPRQIRTIGRHFDPLAGEAPLDRSFGYEEPFPAADGKLPALVQLHDAIRPADRAWLTGAGYEVLRIIPSRTLLVLGPAHSLATLSRDERVRWAGAFRPDDKLAADLLRETFAGPLYLEVALLPHARVDQVVGAARGAAPSLSRESLYVHDWGGILRLRLDGAEAHAALVALANDPSVESVTEWREGALHNDHSIYTVQSYDLVNRTNYALSATVWNHGILGTDQIVAVVDSGLDVDACFFKYGPGGHAIPQSPLPPDPGALDPGKKVVGYAIIPGAHAEGTTGHGSHVAGTIAGDNHAQLSTPSSPGHDAGDGIAPQAQLYFQDVAAVDGSFLAGTVDPLSLSRQAYDAGARIQSNSWGSQYGNQIAPYDYSALGRDLFTWEHEEFLHVFSMGNLGLSGNTRMASPAVAKNVIGVAATTHGSSPQNASAIAVFSAPGLTRDGRIKPDVAAPGGDVTSASGNTLFGDDTCSVTGMSGTSMAAPTAAGAATLARQYFTDGFYPGGSANPADVVAPAAALLKAILINGADDLSPANVPNPNEGWGRVHLDDALFFAGDPTELRVWDRRNADGLLTGAEETFALAVAAGTPLRVTLVWTDPPPAPAALSNLVNDLDLEVSGPAGLFRGNVLSAGQSVTGGVRDAINNVEQVLLAAPSAGTYTIQVKAHDVPGNGYSLDSDRQGYALVATFDPACAGSTPAMPLGAMVTPHAGMGLDVSWNSVPGATRYRVDRAAGTCAAPLGGFTFLGETGATGLTDATAQGGYDSAYRIRAVNACGESVSACVSGAATGNCTLDPAFAGAESVENLAGTAACDLALAWQPAVSRCPTAPAIVYSVYRGTDPYFTPAPGNRIAGGLSTRGYTDSAVAPLVTYYYVVRAEDGTTGNGGPDHGGNEDRNPRVAHRTTQGGDSHPAIYHDDGGDTNAKLILDPPWRVTAEQNNTPGGSLSYHAAEDGGAYRSNVCAAATTPPVELQPGSPQLRYFANYDIEWNWDGVVVEISADGGTTWVDLPPDDVAGVVSRYPGVFAGEGGGSNNACGYPQRQGQISNPNNFGGPIGWYPFTHELAGYAGHTVQIRWNFSSDEALEFAGFYLDDVQITYASEPYACGGSGFVSLDRAVYGCADSVTLRLHDADLAGSGSAVASLASDSEGPQVVTLVETSVGSGIFEGAVPTSPTAPTPGDGLVAVANGDALSAKAAGAIGAPARVDCTAPAIDDVRAVEVTHDSAWILWGTSELADSQVDHGIGLPVSTTHDPRLETAHSVVLDGLAPCTTYVFRVLSTDEAGNVAIDDDGGAYYAFTTAADTSIVVASSDTPLAIPDLDLTFGATSVLSVPGGRTVVDVDVEVNLTHPNAWEPTIRLIAPDSTTVLLSSQNGVVVFGQNYSGTIFDDEALVSVTSGVAPFDGSWKPEQLLSGLDGRAVGGSWSLNVTDGINIPTSPPNVGQIASWTLRATASLEWCAAHGSYVSHAPIADSCSTGGAGHQNGQWDPGELVQFNLTLINDGSATLTNVAATVTPLVPGALMTTGTASFGTILPDGTATSGPYAAQLSTGFACFSSVGFRVDVVANQGISSHVFEHPIGNPTSATCQLVACNRPGPVPDGISGDAMRASRANAVGSAIDLTWSTSICAAQDYMVLYGGLSSVSALEPVGAACGLGTSGAYAWSGVPGGNLWFVVVGHDGNGTEGSWGLDSTGSHRRASVASGACGNFARDDNTVCP